MKRKIKKSKVKTYKFIEYLCGGGVFICSAAMIGNIFIGNIDAILGWGASSLFALGCMCLAHKLKFLTDYLKT